jgi:hypothetical protein
MELSGLSGASIAYRCKQLARLRTVPSLVLVPSCEPKLREQAEFSPADKVMLKPYTARGLKLAMRDLLAPSFSKMPAGAFPKPLLPSTSSRHIPPAHHSAL